MTTPLAIALAVLAAVGLAFGAMYQHRGVAREEDHPGGFRIRTFLRLFRSRIWLLGLLCLGLGTVANVVALSLAPVMVVQPIGAISLLISILLAVRYRGLRITRRIATAVAVCALSVAGFVGVSATIASTRLHVGAESHPVAWIAFALSAVFLVIVLAWRRPPQLLLVLGAGLLFACVATTTHLVSNQLFQAGPGAVSLLNLCALVVAAAIGTWFVQAAYSAGPPEMVIAGLTVVDPIFAVVLGSLVLGEAAGAPPLVVLLMSLTGLVACAAVVVLSRYHPDVIERESARRASRAVVAPTGSRV